MAQFGRYSSEDRLEGARHTLLQGMGLLQRKQALGLKERQVNVQEREMELAKERQAKEFAETPVPERQFSPGEIAGLKAQGGAIAKKLGFRLNAVTPVANAITDFTKQGYKKIDVYRALKKEWPKYIKPAQESIMKAMEQTSVTGDSEEFAKLQQAYDEISSDKFLDQMMPASARYEEDIRKKEKLAKLKATKTSKPERLYETVTGWQEREKAIGKLKPRSTKGGKSPKEKRLNDLKKAYFDQEKQKRSAAKNIDPLMEDMESRVKEVQEDAAKKQEVIAKEYVKAGGKPEDLGIGTPTQETKKPSSYKTAEAVRAAHKAGKLGRQEALKILRSQFGYK